MAHIGNMAEYLRSHTELLKEGMRVLVFILNYICVSRFYIYRFSKSNKLVREWQVYVIYQREQTRNELLENYFLYLLMDNYIDEYL